MPVIKSYSRRNLPVETNGLDIYVPHFYEHDCSLGYFLENSDKYFTFFEDKINTELWEKDIPAKHLLEKVIALSLPSNNEICYNVAYAIVKKYGYKTKEFNKKDGNKEIFDKYTDKEKRTGFPIWFLQDDGHFRSCWKLFFFALGCLIIKRIPTTIGKLPPTTEIRQKHLGVMKFETRLYKTAQRFLLLLGLGYLTTPTLPLLAVKNQEFELEKYLMKLDPYFATGLYEKLKKEQSSVKLVYELEGYETMAQFVDEKGNDRLTSHPITDRQIKRFLVNKMLRSEKLKLVENRIIDDWDLPLPTIRDRFSDEDELSWA